MFSSALVGETYLCLVGCRCLAGKARQTGLRRAGGGATVAAGVPSLPGGVLQCSDAQTAARAPGKQLGRGVTAWNCLATQATHFYRSWVPLTQDQPTGTQACRAHWAHIGEFDSFFVSFLRPFSAIRIGSIHGHIWANKIK